MMSKEQEKKIVDQIAALIDEAGTGSYIAMAFEGCVSDALDNIEYDFGNSWKHRAEHYAKLQDDAIRENVKQTERIKELEKQVETSAKATENHEKSHNEWIKAWNAQQEKINEQAAKLEAAEAEIVKLKLKLFDYLMAEKETA